MQQLQQPFIVFNINFNLITNSKNIFYVQQIMINNDEYYCYDM